MQPYDPYLQVLQQLQQQQQHDMPHMHMPMMQHMHCMPPYWPGMWNSPQMAQMVPQMHMQPTMLQQQAPSQPQSQVEERWDPAWTDAQARIKNRICEPGHAFERKCQLDVFKNRMLIIVWPEGGAIQFVDVVYCVASWVNPCQVGWQDPQWKEQDWSQSEWPRASGKLRRWVNNPEGNGKRGLLTQLKLRLRESGSSHGAAYAS